MVTIEITKEIKISGIAQKVGYSIEVANSAAKIYISKGFAKEAEKKSNKQTAEEVANIIDKCETKEELKKYESDTRQIVVNAYKKKLKELA